MAILNEVSRVASKYASHYSAVEDGSGATADLTRQEYEALAVAGAGEPPRRGLPVGKTWRWVRAEEIFQFNTVSGDMGVLDCYQEGGDLVVNAQSGSIVPLKARHFTITKPAGLFTVLPNPFGLAIAAGVLTVVDAALVRRNWNLL